jgi:hypothetical protein
MKKIVAIFWLQFIVFQLQVIRAQSIKEIMLSNGVIYTKTDTIKCFIPMDDILQSVVRYKTRKEDRSFQRIKAYEIISLKRGVNTYKSIEYKGEKILLKVAVQGRVNVYEMEIFKPTSFSQNTGPGYPPAMIPSQPTVFYISDSLQICKLSRMNYKDEIKKMLVRGESFYEEIDRLKYNDLGIYLPRIISNYNFKTRDI